MRIAKRLLMLILGLAVLATATAPAEACPL